MPRFGRVRTTAHPMANTTWIGVPAAIIQIVFRIDCQNSGSFVNMNR